MFALLGALVRRRRTLFRHRVGLTFGTAEGETVGIWAFEGKRPTL